MNNIRITSIDLDRTLDPDPRTRQGTRDLEAMFWALKGKVSRKSGDDDDLSPVSPIIFSVVDPHD